MIRLMFSSRIGGKMMRQPSFSTGVIAGAAIGTVAALLFAPKAGKENRQIVVTRSGTLREKADGFFGRRGRERASPEEVGASTNGYLG